MNNEVLNIDSIVAKKVLVECTYDSNNSVYKITPTQQKESFEAITPEKGELLVIFYKTNEEDPISTFVTYAGDECENIHVQNKPFVVTGDGKTNLYNIVINPLYNPHFVHTSLSSELKSLDNNINSLISNNVPKEVGTKGSKGTATTLSRSDHVHSIKQATVESILTNQNEGEPHLRRIFAGTEEAIYVPGNLGDIYIKLDSEV